MQKILFHYADRQLHLVEKKKIHTAVENLFKDEKKPLERLDYIFCSDEYLLKINQTYLKHDFYTDVVTFDLSEENKGITGEIYISIDRVKDNARQLKQPFSREILRVIFHGALHLCGYNDKKPPEIPIMRAKEEEYLGKFEKQFK